MKFEGIWTGTALRSSTNRNRFDMIYAKNLFNFILPKVNADYMYKRQAQVLSQRSAQR